MSTAEEIKPDPSASPKTITQVEGNETATAPVDTPENSNTNIEQSTFTGMAAAATGSATNAAIGVKDSVFSMFGGGVKKDKKEDNEAQDRSGSSKAQKEAEGEDEQVELAPIIQLLHPGLCCSHRINLLNRKMCISSPLSV